MLLKTDFMYINPMVPAFILACLAMSSAYAESIPCNTAKNIAQSKILCAKTLEKSRSQSGSKDSAKAITDENMQLSFFQLDDPVLENIREELTKIDINTLTPIEALMKLNSIKKMIGK